MFVKYKPTPSLRLANDQYLTSPNRKFSFLKVSIKKNGHHICGGAIYKDDRIVTSSHCCQKFESNDVVEIVAGDVKPSDGVDKSHAQRRNVSTVLEYVGSIHQNDSSESK